MVSLLTLLLAGASPAVAHSERGLAASNQPDCPRATAMHAYDRSKPPKMQRLGDLPPANAYSAVYRLVDGCEVPIVGDFQKMLGMESLLVGFALSDDRIHSPNEKFDVEMLHKGTTTAAALYEKLASLKPTR